VKVSADGSCSIDTCSTKYTQTPLTDNLSACGVATENCFTEASDLVLIEVVVSNIVDFGYSFDIIAINQYLPLTSPVTTSIGTLIHYYSYSAAALQSLVFKLTVVNGPALSLYVFGASDNSGGIHENFGETVICAFGDCYVYVPSQAKRSNDTTYYITLTSSTLLESPFLDRNVADLSVKETNYVLSVTAGTTNCISASSITTSAPFCTSVLKGISNNVWSFADVASKDEEAECLFNSIADSLVCPQASNDCLDWVKTLSCLITFPQCDSNGFQAGVCRSVCSLVDQYCGADWELQASHFTSYACETAFYVDTNSSTSSPSHHLLLLLHL
jgi:hypothetical protein